MGRKDKDYSFWNTSCASLAPGHVYPCSVLKCTTQPQNATCTQEHTALKALEISSCPLHEKKVSVLVPTEYHYQDLEKMHLIAPTERLWFDNTKSLPLLPLNSS